MRAIDFHLVLLVERMLQHTAYKQAVNAVDSDGNSAVHYAAKHSTSQMADVLKLLTAHGALPARLSSL